MKSFLPILLFLPILAAGQLTLSPVFSDHMVMQRDAPLRIWGKGIPGKKISVSFDKQKHTSIVQKDSSWIIALKSMRASLNPLTLTISSGKDRIRLNDILVGDIWICSGQSNMEWPLQNEMHWKDEKLQASQPLVRLNNPPPVGRYVYGVPYNDSLNRRLNSKDFYEWNTWQQCDSNSAKSMSAIGYYFAKAIVQEENIPVGIINLSIGGAPIETFISQGSLSHDKRFALKVKGNWFYNNSLPEWTRERGLQNVGINTKGFSDGAGPNHAYKPGFAFESGVRPLSNFPIKGVLWYQGESNSLDADRVKEYPALMQVLINDYRRNWNQPKMPFYWVQLSSIDTTHYESRLWPEFRDEQRKLLNEVKYGGIAVCSDIGLRDNVHPTNKKLVGERLSRWALNQVYGKTIIPSGPLPMKAVYQEGNIIVSFQYSDGLKTADGTSLSGFSIDGTNDAKAIIRHNKIIIPSGQKPAYVFYGWKPFSDANLVNNEMLPASTFKIPVK